MSIEVHKDKNRYILTVQRETPNSELANLHHRLITSNVSTNDLEILRNLSNRLIQLQLEIGPSTSSFSLRDEYLALHPREYEYIKNLVPNLSPINYTKGEKNSECNTYTPTYEATQNQKTTPEPSQPPSPSTPTPLATKPKSK